MPSEFFRLGLLGPAAEDSLVSRRTFSRDVLRSMAVRPTTVACLTEVWDDVRLWGRRWDLLLDERRWSAAGICVS